MRKASGFSLSGKGTLDKVTHFLSEKENKTKSTRAIPCKSKEQQKVQKKLVTARKVSMLVNHCELREDSGFSLLNCLKFVLKRPRPSTAKSF